MSHSYAFTQCGLCSIKRLSRSSVQSLSMVVSGSQPTSIRNLCRNLSLMDQNVQSTHTFLSTTDGLWFPWPSGRSFTAMCLSSVIKTSKRVLSLEPSCLHQMSAPLGDDPSSASSTCRITQRMLQVLLTSTTNDSCDLRFQNTASLL